MKRLFLTLAILGCAASALFADDQWREVQTQLKAQGFYYGDLNGEKSAETGAALRRYQIRNGLEVTGTLNDETLKALGIGLAAAPRPPQEAPPPAAPPAPAHKATPPINLLHDETLEQADKNFLRREETHQKTQPAPRPAPAQAPVPNDPSFVPPPSPLLAPSADFPVLFANTPYANAPREVQVSTLRRAQTLLASRGHYDAAIDGAPGPATEEAVLSFQGVSRLPLTGRLDLETLDVMHLLPGRAAGAPRGFGPEPRPSMSTRTYRGIWIH